MIVRPPEQAFPGGPSLADAKIPDSLPQQLKDMLTEAKKIKTEPEKYGAALRDWVNRGGESRYALSPAEVVERSRPRPMEQAEAAAHFELGEYFHSKGRDDDATQHWREAHRLRKRLSRLDPSLHTVLDVACGTGAHDEHLCRYYEVDGLDLRTEFLDAARRRNPSGRYHVADMREFRLDRLYDTVPCLFSSIGYARTGADLERTLACFRDHLTPRGVVVIEPL